MNPCMPFELILAKTSFTFKPYETCITAYCMPFLKLFKNIKILAV